MLIYISEVGLKNQNYEEIQKRQSRTVGQINSNFVVLRDSGDDNFKVGFKMKGYSLHSNLNNMEVLIMTHK